MSVRALAALFDRLGRRTFAGVAAAALLTGALCAPAAAANWLEKTLYLWGPKFDSQIPACDNTWAIETIRHRFATTQDRFWNSELSIQSVEQVQEDSERDRWFTAQEALDYGFVDHIRESASDVIGGGGTEN